MRMQEVRKRLGPAPGTRAFGEQARIRREHNVEAARRGDLRVKTAYKTVDAAARKKQAYLEGD